MKYKVGDKVKVREDLQTNKDYNNCTCVEEMEEYKGVIATITKCFGTDIDDDGAYEIDLDDGEWFWTDDMLEEGGDIEKEADNNFTVENVLNHTDVESGGLINMTRVEMVQRLIIDIDNDSELLELIETNPKWELIGVRRWNSKDNKFHELTFENVVTTTDTSLVKFQLLADKEIKY